MQPFTAGLSRSVRCNDWLGRGLRRPPWALLGVCLHLIGRAARSVQSDAALCVHGFKVFIDFLTNIKGFIEEPRRRSAGG